MTGLDEASRYTYVLSVLDANGTPLHVYIGDFATLGYTGELKYDGNEIIPTPPIIPGNPDAQGVTTGKPSLPLPSREGKKYLKDGKLYLMYKGRMYNVQGIRVE